ncbi:MAG: DGQHR domain-containing protein [Acidobacteria bacterium]|nr:DGQHR domain-containing protein [Acidobacteriota bacterium]
MKTAMLHFSIPCLIFKQRSAPQSPMFALFAAPAGDILQWAAIRRRADDPEGPQRRLSQAKINAIKRFMDRDDRNTVPPAITVTLNIDQRRITLVDPARSDLHTMRLIELRISADVDEVQKPGLVIDGQHRLLGMNAYDPDCRVNVVALLNVDDMEKAFQFLVINNKVTRVPSDHIRTLALDYQDQELAERLQTARLTLDENLRYVGIVDSDETSPFRGHIALVSHQGDEMQRFVPPAAIENAISAIQKKAVRELEADDALCEFFYAIWSSIKEQWGDLWIAGSKLMHKVSIVAMTVYMTDALVAKYDWDELDVTNPADVRKTVQKILAHQTAEFWQCNWSIRISDAKAVQDTIIESLTKISRNIRANQPWHEDIDIVAL